MKTYLFANKNKIMPYSNKYYNIITKYIMYTYFS